MKIKTIDSSGYEVEFEFSDKRANALDKALRAMGIEGGGVRAARDGDPLFHTVGQLAYLENEALTKEYEPRVYEDLLGECITSEAGEWAATVEYESIDHTGKGQRLSPSGDNMPMADVVTNKTSITVAEGGIGYSYTLHDLEVAARGIAPLPQSRQEAAVEGYKNHMDDVLIQGEEGSSFKGLFNDSAVPTGARPSAAAWTAATSDTIIADLNAGLSTVYTNSKQNHLVETIALAPSLMQYLMKPRATGSDKSTLAWFLENNFTTLMSNRKLRIVSGGSYLETAGTGTSKMAAFFTAKRSNIKSHVPMPIRFGAPQPHMNKLVVPSRYRYAGTNNRRVHASYFMYGL